MASGSIKSNTGTHLNLRIEWSSTISQSPNTSIVTAMLYLDYRSLYVGARSSQSLTVNGDTLKYDTAAISQSSTAEHSKLLATHLAIVAHNSDGKKTITISAAWNFNGTYDNKSITTISASASVALDVISVATAAKAPLTFTVSPDSYDIYDNIVSLSWSSAGSGTNNAITGYEIQYCKEYRFDLWTPLRTVTSTATGGSILLSTLAVLIPPGNYVQLRIRTRGSAGSNYYSDWKTSNTILHIATSAATAPTTFTASPSIYTDSATLSWSGACGGALNAITGHEIQYRTGNSTSNYGAWTALKNVSSTATSGSTTAAPSASREHYVQFRIRMRGAAGSSYYSDWKTSNAIQKNPLSAPTTFTAAPKIYEDNVNLSWSGAGGGTLNKIAGYEIQCRASADDSTWGAWGTLKTVSGTAASGSTAAALSITRGYYLQFRIRTRGSAGSSYYSEWKTSNSVQQNPTFLNVPVGNQYVSAPLYCVVNGQWTRVELHSVSDGVWKGCRHKSY